MHPGQISITDFSYDLPEARIAQHPLPERDASKLLVYREGKISDTIFKNIAEELPADTLLVFNNTRVIHARLEFFRDTGGRIEVFCTEPVEPAEVQQLMKQASSCKMKCMIGNLKKWKPGELLGKKLRIGEEEILLRADLLSVEGDLPLVQFSWTPAHFSFAEIVEAAGLLPLPPYMKREAEAEDEERYQTVYAQHQGSVAAPTAGLHFSESVLQQLREKNVRFEYVTLHVGAGTFRPVKSKTMSGHEMHREQILVPRSLVEQLARNEKRSTCAVGTTALRTLESLYWFGRKLMLNPGKHFDELFVAQWEPYEDSAVVPPAVAFRTLLDWMRENGKETLRGSTALLIAPGYEFKTANALITNFHQPQSTLLLLVAAFVGEDFRKIYDYALENDFRFLSYGDSSLLFR